MRKQALIKKLRTMARDGGHDLFLEREGGNHTVYVINGRRIPIPRHNEIAEGTARAIIRQAEEATK